MSRRKRRGASGEEAGAEAATPSGLPSAPESTAGEGDPAASGAAAGSATDAGVSQPWDHSLPEEAPEAAGEPPEDAEDALDQAGELPEDADDATDLVSGAPGRAGEEPEGARAAADQPEAAGPALETILEALLFSAAAPVPMPKLLRALDPADKDEILAALERLGAMLGGGGRGIRLVETGSGWQLLTVPECASFVRRFFAEKPPRLSRALLETLAIVAYRQPATRGEVEAVRGVDCDAVLGALLTRGLVQVVGRRHAPGRPVEYGTTGEFLELFSMRDLNELPPLPDPSTLASLVADAAGALGEPAGEEADEDATAEPGDEPGDEAPGPSGSPQDGEGSELDGALAEDPEPGGDRLEAGGGGPDPGGPGQGEREGGGDPGGEGGPDQGPHHG